MTTDQIVFGLAVFLFVTNGEQMNWIVSAITAAATGILAFMRLLTIAQSDRGKAAP